MVRLMLILGTSRLTPGDYLRLVGRLCRLCKDPAECAALFTTATPDVFIRPLLGLEARVLGRAWSARARHCPLDVPRPPLLLRGAS